MGIVGGLPSTKGQLQGFALAKQLWLNASRATRSSVNVMTKAEGAAADPRPADRRPVRGRAGAGSAPGPAVRGCAGGADHRAPGGCPAPGFSAKFAGCFLGEEVRHKVLYKVMKSLTSC